MATHEGRERKREEGECVIIRKRKGREDVCFLTCAMAWSSCFARFSCSYRDTYVGRVGSREGER